MSWKYRFRKWKWEWPAWHVVFPIWSILPFAVTLFSLLLGPFLEGSPHWEDTADTVNRISLIGIFYLLIEAGGWFWAAQWKLAAFAMLRFAICFLILILATLFSVFLNDSAS